MRRKAIQLLLSILLVSAIITLSCQSAIEPVDKGELENQITILKNELVEKEQTIQELEREIAALSEELSASQKMIEKLESELAAKAEIAPAPTPWLTINLPVPREIQQANYSQIVEILTVNYSPTPSGIADLTDEYGNNYKMAYWNEEPTGEITFTLEAIISREVGMEPVITPDPYPIIADQIPEDIKLYLEPAWGIQSDDLLIKAQAQILSQDLTREVEVVTNTLEWISQNIKWGCPRDIEDYKTDAVWTLENEEGNCVNFANLMIALFRAQGIPARYVSGIKGYEHSNPGFMKPEEGSDWHVWTEIYYPEVGWVRYDATYFSHPCHIPYGIQFRALPDGISGKQRGTRAGYFIEKWQLVGLGNDKVKLTLTQTFSPEE